LVGVFVGVAVGVAVGVFVGVFVGVAVGVCVGVMVGVFVGVGGTGGALGLLASAVTTQPFAFAPEQGEVPVPSKSMPKPPAPVVKPDIPRPLS
jgi:hypothetical protein